MCPSSDNAGDRHPSSARHPSTDGERPQAEPEILPPEADLSSAQQGNAFVFTHRGVHVHVRRPGPFGIAMILLGGAALSAIGVMLLLGAALVGAAALGVVVVVALLSRLFRGPANR